ncbi:type II toxin-antitoxin system PemK/MazF family toxin [Cellulophaga baltica]|uniref:type II toxin-antitoxin system PemK/MazF family toxin n=1 Tax=Cellulophaga baltica TaxID=76594 RepID=UPI0004169E3A|nr:type II toxin-antitoxin system PemK/MazF family toxin [Cellulophaga baltica]AIY14643.1 hypothetical protein M667_16500 [Cellulophaga baltica NN016038]
MAFKRGDIIMVYFDLPYSKGNDSHPAIIISNDDVHNSDDIFICVMITSVDGKDLFSFEIEDSMLENKKNVSGQARCHLLAFVQEKQIAEKRPINTLKPNAVNRLVEKINEISISEDID